MALQVAEQMSDYLLRGVISNAVNVPRITAEEARRLKPWVKLAEQLGRRVVAGLCDRPTFGHQTRAEQHR